MNEEVIPPSPPVKLNRLKSRLKDRHSNSMRRIKQKHPILSLRSKNQDKLNGIVTNILPSTSSNVRTSAQKTPSIENQVNIYAGLDDVSIEEKQQTESMLIGFDILAQSKMIEQCNQYDLSQKREPTQKDHATHRFPSTKDFCSLATLLSMEQHTNGNQPTHFPHEHTCPLNAEAKEISLENLQFSEWPTDFSDTTCANEHAHTDHGRENSSAPSIVQSILQDFCDDGDDTSNQEEAAQNPPFILIRRAQRKTYKRTSNAQLKTLLFDNDGGGGDNDREHSVVNESTGKEWSGELGNERCEKHTDDNDGAQNNDIDLNASRLIVENLTKLSTFFTQSQSHVLDFNVDLSHTIHDFEKRFDDFVYDLDDDIHNDRIHFSYSNDNNDSDIQVKARIATTSNETNDKFNKSLFNDDFEHPITNIETPEGMQCSKYAKKNENEISTPLSAMKVRVEDSGMHSTPSTSKMTTLNDHRVAKRLRFAAEANQMEIDNGFALASAHNAPDEMLGFTTARGCTIQMTDKAMKRAAGAFADIDNEYKHIDPVTDAPYPKRIKTGRKVTFLQNESSIATPERTDHAKFDGFQFANGKNVKSSATAKARNIFGEDLSDLDLNESITEFKPSHSAVPSDSKCGGFKLVSGKNVKTSECATAKTRNIFGEDLSDLDLNESTDEFKPSHIAEPNNLPEMGFKTAAGSSIAVTATNMHRYTKLLDNMDRDICEETDADYDQTAMECKTPIAKSNQYRRSDAFTTSTPNPNVTPGFKSAMPPITPIHKQSLAELNDFNSWVVQDDDIFNQMFCTPTQLTNVSHPNRSLYLNDTMASDAQQSVDDSGTETGVDVLQITGAVKCARKMALTVQQAECFKKPHSICPLVGWLFLLKILHSMQLHELGTPKIYKRDQLEHFGIQSNVIDVNVSNALQFKFDMWNFYPMDVCRTNVDGIDVHDDMKLIMDENSRIGVREVTSAFLHCPTVDPKLIPDHWINNSLKWIITKLASYERSFPDKFAGRSLTPENVLAQLKYRYDREIDKVERSAIRRIVEKDDTPAKRMILFVSRIIEQSLAYSLELSDGWYSIRTHSLDTVLSSAISKGKIVVGTKLVIQGAELIGIEEACSPLEMPTSVALKISANSTRRAKWFTKLGYCKESWPFAISLNSVYGNGGIITRMTAYIARIYPLIFAVKEKTADGQKTVFRSNKAEQRQSKKDDKKQFEIIEKFYSEATAEIEKEYDAKMKRHKSPRKKLSDIDDGEELWNFMEYSNDGVSFETDLTATQKKLLNDYQTKFYDAKQDKITTMVKEKLNAIDGPAKSTALQKVRLIDATAPNAQKTAILSIWKADDIQILLHENTLLDLRYVTANGMRGKDVQLTSNSKTVLREVRPFTSTVLHAAFSRQLTPIADIDGQQFKPNFNEFDTLGIVVKIDEAMPNHYQSVFVADTLKNILCIKFWGGIPQYGHEDIVKEREIIVICQLDWRAHSRLNINGIPQAFVTETTTFSKSLKSTDRIYALNCLREQFDQMDVSTFIEECVWTLGQNSHTNKENSTSNQQSNSTFNLNSNQSMLSRTTPASSAVASNKAAGVLQKIERLRQYGSPPPLSASYLKIHKPNRTAINTPFKNPCKRSQ